MVSGISCNQFFENFEMRTETVFILFDSRYLRVLEQLYRDDRSQASPTSPVNTKCSAYCKSPGHTRSPVDTKSLDETRSSVKTKGPIDIENPVDSRSSVKRRTSDDM